MAKARKSILQETRLTLWARAAGRCELCGKELDTAHIFDVSGNFGQVAHINAYSSGGPRHKEGMTEDELNASDNLMLLCPEHHKMIDDNPDDFPEEELKRIKADWEGSIAEFVRDLAPTRATVVTMLHPVGGMVPHITPTEMRAALRGKSLYAADSKPFDLAEGIGSTCSLQGASAQIERRMTAFRYIHDDSAMPVAVFALAPQPLLIKLGSLLGGVRDIRIFQPNRAVGGWTWPEKGHAVDFLARRIGGGLPDSCCAVVVISLSGVINKETIRGIPNGAPIYELTAASPDTGIVISEETVRAFVKEAISLIDGIHESYPRVKELHVYPAMPASLAVGFGTALRFNLISKYVVHEKADGTFGEALCIGRFDG